MNVHEKIGRIQLHRMWSIRARAERARVHRAIEYTPYTFLVDESAILSAPTLEQLGSYLSTRKGTYQAARADDGGLMWRSIDMAQTQAALTAIYSGRCR